ncbi:glycosyltransferase family protein [Agriterribacter sp.]|uniref:glycosyltransferase family protein n=1 Tax=Agriterribacter sp. TaxID=2821509 RepID=UPI002CA4A075|nr:glycosyltransferase family protein [Agriterribacter sp.]HTN07818.1 glycosyltransferase family protein [Agriterribacter sp.]
MDTPKILVAPLDWGFGHATRCIPIINELVSRGCTVWIASGGSCLQLLRKEFPLVPFLRLDGYNVIYHNTKSNFRWTIAKQIPKIIAAVKREQHWLKKIMDEHHFDIIISDNRYGLYSGKAVSVFITHQLTIKTGIGPGADRLLQKMNYRYLKNFDECWVPDFEGQENLAGKLSHPAAVPPHTTYIGALSRLKKKEESRKYDLLIVLSGPEPRRTIWERLLLEELKTYKGETLIVRGLPDNNDTINTDAGIAIVNFLSSDELGTAIQQSEWVICRSGYTSVMDLVQLEHKAILVPTPGQPEQEYLAQWLHQHKFFYTVTEDSFSLQQCLREAAGFPFNFSVFQPFLSNYKKQIERLIQQYLMRNRF